jgi:hypothetical protein
VRSLWGDEEIEVAFSKELRHRHKVAHKVTVRSVEGETRLVVQVGKKYAAMVIRDPLRLPLKELSRVYCPVLTEALEDQGAYA